MPNEMLRDQSAGVAAIHFTASDTDVAQGAREALVRRYGEPLAQAVAAAAVGRVVVVRSSFGWHALRVDAEQPGRLPPLSELRPRVLADWQRQRRADNLARGLAELRARVPVEVEVETEGEAER